MERFFSIQHIIDGVNEKMSIQPPIFDAVATCTVPPELIAPLVPTARLKAAVPASTSEEEGVEAEGVEEDRQEVA